MSARADVDGFTFDATVHERLDGHGWEVRVWVDRSNGVRVARFPVPERDDADELAHAIREYIRGGGDVDEMMGRQAEEPS
jgi:hypothetical protein